VELRNVLRSVCETENTAGKTQANVYNLHQLQVQSKNFIVNLIYECLFFTKIMVQFQNRKNKITLSKFLNRGDATPIPFEVGDGGATPTPSEGWGHERAPQSSTWSMQYCGERCTIYSCSRA